jgi:tetratricopeptide (TPR) repeat protein
MLWITTLWAAAPAVDIRWRGPAGQLFVAPAEGTTLAPEAPATLVVDDRTLQLDGAALTDGIGIGDVRGRTLDGHLALQVCEKATGICAPAEVRFSASLPDRRNGSETIPTRPVAADTRPDVFNVDVVPATEAAFARAEASGHRVLLDFSAVWCPPCNLLAAEVLHAPDVDTTLAGLEVALVDVDHPSSWALKDRYAVGSYPTVVVTDAQGTEYGRMVGYPGRQAFLAFLADATAPVPDWSTVDPATVAPDEAARAALALLDAGETDVSRWLARAETADTWAAHVARFRVAPDEDAVADLARRAPKRALDWLPHVGDWAEGPGREAVLAVLPQILSAVGPVEAADVLWYAAQLHDPVQAQADYALAATLLQGALTGDHAHDRGHIEYIATLLTRAGQPARALALLDATARDHPDDPTWTLAGAMHLNAQGEHAEALRRAERALAHAWGDNRLRVAHEAATALVGLDRSTEAAALAAETLAAVPAPEAALDVRTHRYREKLAAFVSEE